MAERQCLACGGDRLVARLRREPVTVVQCRACGLVAVEPRPSPEEIRRLYLTYDDHVPEEAAPVLPAWRARQRASAHREILDAIARHRTPGALLDIGCSFGAFLVTAQARGWLPHGVDLSRRAVRGAERLAGLRVSHGTVFDAHFDAERFDAVTLLGVFEHLDNPRPTLVEAFRLLRPGGVIALEVPNATFNLLRGRLHPSLFYLGNHLFNFTPKSLITLLQDAGFRGVRVWCGVADRSGGRAFNALKAAWIATARRLERLGGWPLGPALVALAVKPAVETD